MERYDYMEAIKEDVRQWIEDNREAFGQVMEGNEYESFEEMRDWVHDGCWESDYVTGNASGSYYCNSWKAEEALCHNWDLLVEAIEEGFAERDVMMQGPEHCDVTIRCYLLGQAVTEVLEEMDAEREA